jgi:hypothetical protein
MSVQQEANKTIWSSIIDYEENGALDRPSFEISIHQVHQMVSLDGLTCAAFWKVIVLEKILLDDIADDPATKVPTRSQQNDSRFGTISQISGNQDPP